MTTKLGEPQLRLLSLNQGEVKDTELLRLQKGWTIHFVLGPSLAARNVRVFVNQPKESKSGPNRNKYRELEWNNLSSHKSDIYDIFAEVPLVLAGSFNYYFTIDGSAEIENTDGSGYFLVDPTLRIGEYEEKLSLDGICCQTYLTKSLGLFSEWEDRLRVAKETSYNMVHFTPLQELGKSNSCYCIKDQLKLNPAYSGGGKTYTMDDVAALVNHMNKDWEVLSLTDLVFNHTANESPWIQTNPECVYNVVNTPHLKPAYLLDAIIRHFSLEISQGLWEERGIPTNLCEEHHINTVIHCMKHELLPKHKIQEYFMLQIEDVLQQFRNAVLAGTYEKDANGSEKTDQARPDLEIIPDPKHRRLKASIQMPVAVELFYYPLSDNTPEDTRVEQACHALQQRLVQLNEQKASEVNSHLEAAINNLAANIRWRFIDGNGPRLPAVTEEEPIMYNYFTKPKSVTTVEDEEAIMHTDNGAFYMAHNGWVMSDDPLRNFAEPGSNVYLRRELIPWGDSVKLKYGNKPEDCPFLWNQMKKYSQEAARIFHGVRLDNCHSTPIHVAEYMLDEARRVRPDLYVIAELFTSSEHTDNIFINRLGINSLIREGLKAWSSHELGRLVHRFGGQPVGAFIQPPARPLVATMAHAMFMDQTHDNESPIEKRTALDLLPSAALVAMTHCATGSNRGYDELVPHHINVVTEPRLYQSWEDGTQCSSGQINKRTGITMGKKALNTLHQTLYRKGFDQVYVDQVDDHIVAVTRHNPNNHKSVILVARTVFSEPHDMKTGHVPPLCVPGLIDEIILEARMIKKSDAGDFKKDDSYINGLPQYSMIIREHIKINESDMVECRWGQDKESIRELEFVNFPPGSVIAISVDLLAAPGAAILELRRCLQRFGYRMHTYSGRNLSEISSTDLEQIVTALSMSDISRVLYRCDQEEKDDGLGVGAYDVPGYGPLPYCGLQGIVTLLNKIRPVDDLGHPLCENIRQGMWLAEYLSHRLKLHPTTERLGHWFEKIVKLLSATPGYLIPRYFDAIITGVYLLVLEVAWLKMSPFVQNGSSFVRSLAMGSLQFCSVVKTAPLPNLSPNLAPPFTPHITDDSGHKHQACVTLAAGLPHFASGIFRNWGRDTFIALRGLMLITGRDVEARFILLAYAGTLRHGLIPNLLGAGSHARYNCRDAVWWWLYCLQQYCLLVKDGYNILSDKVARVFPEDDSQAEVPGICDQLVSEVIQEALQRHADGVTYRERHAGTSIDNDMSPQGFNNQIGIDWSTGFVYGGNEHNCGTWMDKMGSSAKAGNRGKPATPRDGSAVELIGLCKASVQWLADASQKGLFPHDGVTREVNGAQVKVMFSEWSALIQANFEKHFWIDTAPCEDESRPDLVNKRGIYKDSCGASPVWADYQLRPNVPIAMVVAPELFTPANAWTALEATEKLLLGPLGMKTLDPTDWAYHGDYVNSDDSDNPKTAKGFNYHQGPEWVWPLGFFLRAKLHFAQTLDSSHPGLLTDTIDFINSTLSRHAVHMQKSTWKSLPELTNSNGSFCADSCPAQAWSMSCLLEVMYDMAALDEKH